MTPRPLVVPNVPSLIPVMAIAGTLAWWLPPHGSGSSAFRSVHLHLLCVALPYTGIRGVGHAQWLVGERTDVAPGVDAEAETNHCGMGCPACARFERGAARGERHAGPNGNPSVGTRVLWSVGEVAWGEVRCRGPHRRVGQLSTPRPRDRERCPRKPLEYAIGGDGVPVQRPWRHFITTWGEGTSGALADCGNPTVGKPVAALNVTNQPAVSAADRRAGRSLNVGNGLRRAREAVARA